MYRVDKAYIFIKLLRYNTAEIDIILNSLKLHRKKGL